MNNSAENNFRAFLMKLGYAEFMSAKRPVLDSFSYIIETATPSPGIRGIAVEYYYLASEEDLYYRHLWLWNENNRSSFIAVFDNNAYIIDARHKPDFDQPLSKKIIIKSFDYGINTFGYDIGESLDLISKEGIDSSFYFDFVIAHQERKKAFEVDKDLLLNLLELRNDLVTRQNEQIIHLLLLRCLFVKYLEDRGVFDKGFLHQTLIANSPEKLISAFKKVRKINGDLFHNNELQADELQAKYLKKLSDFFGYSDYRTKQGKLFPYQFDKIPIQLISSIYESFLKEKTKKDSGVYYTPSFLVNFVLSQTLCNKLSSKKDVTVFDPACGSGAFLVEAFRILIRANKAETNYEKKKQLLQTQLFGVDLDSRALQIAAFSLYLALLEGEDPEFIQEKIRLESPILPSLLGKTLINANALTDNLEFEVNGKHTTKRFDCIIANPPWGSTPDDDTEENSKIREAIGNKEKTGTIATYKSVSDFQRSQAFLLKSSDWSQTDTILSMVVNNSIFLNENAEGFRRDFLTRYRIEKFYELSDINNILFKKHHLGTIKDDSVEIGANEPCCVVIYAPSNGPTKSFSYVHPKQNRFAENLRLIAFSSKDIIEVQQSDLIAEDLLWRIFVNGNWSDYQIIKKRILEKDLAITIECRRGFQPQKSMPSLGKADWQWLIDINNFSRYHLDKGKLTKFNWNLKLRRRGEESNYEGKRIIIPVRPLSSHGLKFSAIRVSDRYVYKDNIHCIKIKKNGKYINDYRPYLAILNSKFLGYYTHFISSQWGKGEAKRSTLRNVDIEKLPFPKFDTSDPQAKQLGSLVDKIEKLKANGQDAETVEQEIDDLVYGLYNLSDYEKAVVNEFFEINYNKKDAKVSQADILSYGEKFSSIFSLMLKNDTPILVDTSISINLGAVVAFTLNNKGNENIKDKSIDVLQVVKRIQTNNSYFSSILSEEKVKYYDKTINRFYIVKSNRFRDWTERQAIEDANEEIRDIINYLKRNDA